MNKPSKSVIITGVVAGVVGIIIGSSGSSGGTTAAAPLPAVTITAPAPEPVVKTVTEVPKSCLDALDNADVNQAALSTVVGAVGDFFSNDFGPLINAVADSDVAGVNAGTAAVTKLNDTTTTQTALMASTYAANRDACKAAS